MSELLHTEPCQTEPGDAIDLIRAEQGSHLGERALMLRMWMDGEVAGAVHLSRKQMWALGDAMQRAATIPMDLFKAVEGVDLRLDDDGLDDVAPDRLASPAPSRWHLNPETAELQVDAGAIADQLHELRLRVAILEAKEPSR